MRWPPLLLAVLLAGCTEEPSAEHEVAIFPIEMSGGSRTVQFEIAEGTGYWRTDLSARTRDSVTYSARGPDGSTHNSSASLSFPFAHELRVESPAAGTWDLTVRAKAIVDGTLRIVVPDPPPNR